jgi:fibrillarin-like pre-rRNA processing protein
MNVRERNQREIFIKNCNMFLKKGGFGLLALKARSVDVTKRPKVIFDMVREELEKESDYTIVDYRELSPLEIDHPMFVIKKKD